MTLDDVASIKIRDAIEARDCDTIDFILRYYPIDIEIIEYLLDCAMYAKFLNGVISICACISKYRIIHNIDWTDTILYTIINNKQSYACFAYVVQFLVIHGMQNKVSWISIATSACDIDMVDAVACSIIHIPTTDRNEIYRKLLYKSCNKGHIRCAQYMYHVIRLRGVKSSPKFAADMYNNCHSRCIAIADKFALFNIPE